MSILKPAEWRDDPVQAAEDFYDLMTDAESPEHPNRKIYLLRAIRNNATEMTLRMYPPRPQALLSIVCRTTRIEGSLPRYGIGLPGV